MENDKEKWLIYIYKKRFLVWWFLKLAILHRKTKAKKGWKSKEKKKKIRLGFYFKKKINSRTGNKENISNTTDMHIDV